MATTFWAEVGARGIANGDDKSGTYSMGTTAEMPFFDRCCAAPALLPSLSTAQLHAAGTEISDEPNAVSPWGIESDPGAAEAAVSSEHLTLKDARDDQPVQSSLPYSSIVRDMTAPASCQAAVGNAIEGTVDSWRSAFRAELAAGGGLERLRETEKQMVDKRNIQ